MYSHSHPSILNKLQQVVSLYFFSLDVTKVNIFLILNAFANHSLKLDSNFPDTMNQSFAISSVAGTRILDFSIFYVNSNSLYYLAYFKLIKHHYFV